MSQNIEAVIPSNFEQSIQRLDEIVSAMDSDAISLDESLALYAEGVQLLAHCTQTLDEAELKIQEMLPPIPGPEEESK